MSAYVQDEEAVVDPMVADQYMLQDILAMDEPQRTHYIKAWVDAGQFDDEGGLVKLRTPDRKTMKVPAGKPKTFHTFPYQGKTVSRLVALQLLRDYGVDGFYRGLNQATGMSRDSWEALQVRQPELASQYAKRGEELTFYDNYLEQVPMGDTDEDDESQEE